jgi:hypothetical protein
MGLFVQVPGGSLKYTFQWAALLPEGATLVSVAYDAGSLTTVGTDIDTTNANSTIQLSGILHQSLTVVKATATLSDSELAVNQQLVIRGFRA